MHESNLNKLVYLCKNAENPYFVEGVRAQLSPNRWLEMLTFEGWADPDIHYILDGMLYGFQVVDPGSNIPSYCCKNYSSCTTVDNEHKLDKLIQDEFITGKFSKSIVKPHCALVRSHKKKEFLKN